MQTHNIKEDMKCINGSTWKHLGPACALLAAWTPGGGAVLFEDTFTYPDGDVVGAVGSPWAPHSAAGSGPVSIQQGWLVLSADGAEDISALLEGAPYATDGSAGPLYAGFTLEVTALPSTGGAYFAHFRNTASSHRGRLWISQSGAAEGSYRLGVGNSSGADATTGPWDADLQPGTPHRVVLRYVPETGLSTLWVDPGSESDPGVTATDAPGITAISNFSLRQSGDIGQLRIDDLAVSDRFDEVLRNGMRLAVRHESQGLVLSWPVSPEAWRVEWTTNLEAWSVLDAEPTQVGQVMELRPEATGSRAFYRLVQP